MARTTRTSTEAPPTESTDPSAGSLTPSEAAGLRAAEAPPAPEAAPDALPAEAGPVPDGPRDEPPAAPQAEAAPPRSAYVPPPPHQGGSSGGNFLAGLLGGGLAVAAGIGALWLSNPALLRGEAPEPDFTPVTSRIEAQAGETAALAAEVARLSETVGALPAGADPAAVEALSREATARLDDLDAEIAGLSDALDMLRGRVAEIEARPPSGGAEADAIVAALRAEAERERSALEALVAGAEERLASVESEARALEERSGEAARAAVARAALARLQAALDAGGSFASALSDLTASTTAQIPPALIEAAESGVPTLAALRTQFPEAARAALAASIREGVPADAGMMERAGAFLRAQTGARSTAPREGTDPDAVLSRAEAALEAGDLQTALAEIDALPEPGRAAMAEWRRAAASRLAALDAAATLAAALPAR